MIIVLKPNATKKQLDHILERVKEFGLKPVLTKGVERTIIGLVGDEEVIRSVPLEVIPGVEHVMSVVAPFKLVSREFKPSDTVVNVGGVKIGGEKIVVMAGPCSVESHDQLLKIAKAVKKSGAKMLRGGAFKPRTSPYAFQGLGEEGLKYLYDAAQQTGLKVVTELMDVRDVPLVERYADVLQIGARNMQNFNLLREVGLSKKPVLLKRGMSATIQEWLLSAEYILDTGNFDVILCERGIRTFETETRNTLDLNAVPVVKALTHLPVIVDPSHGTGKWSLVTAMARAGIAAGADGLMIEVHHKPEEALSDGAQSLLPKRFDDLMVQVKAVAAAVGRKP